MRPLTTYRIRSAHDWMGIDRINHLIVLVTIPKQNTDTPQGRIDEQNIPCEELTKHLGHIIIRCESETEWELDHIDSGDLRKLEKEVV